mmetsp:Transcript_55843/g.116846  ORF Transcript_55843/g.116846 Transcript_55843/m.116846 type:complete len:112 (+) Transcript_55843:161-496(+)
MKLALPGLKAPSAVAIGPSMLICVFTLCMKLALLVIYCSKKWMANSMQLTSLPRPPRQMSSTRICAVASWGTNAAESGRSRAEPKTRTDSEARTRMGRIQVQVDSLESVPY